MGAYYNEHDPKAAAWLRELIKQGHLPAGEVDERSIEDVCPTELSSFAQCHFFAGIGVWAYSLRQAGWPDDRPVWTGSCPCQPFSAAGKGGGFADERHLWPAWHHLIRECRPATVFGEQVASKDGLGWLDLVQSDMEATDYAFGAFDLCAAGVGAPHIRQRLYFVANATRSGRLTWVGYDGEARNQLHHEGRGETDRVADACEGERGWGSAHGRRHIGDGGPNKWNEDASHIEWSGKNGDRLGPTNGFWGAADWLHCTDGKWRPVEPGTFPLAHGAPARVGRLRGYGNAIVAPLAQTFIEEAMRCIDA